MAKEEGRKRGEKKSRRKHRKKKDSDGVEIERIPAPKKLKSKSRRKTDIRKKNLGLLTDSTKKPLSNPAWDSGKLFTVRKPLDLNKKSNSRNGEQRMRRKHGHRKELKKMTGERKISKEDLMVEGTNGNADRGRRSDVPSNKHRKKPHSLPPLPRTPKSPMSPVESNSDAQSIRRLIGSPPPSGFRQKEISGEIHRLDQDILRKIESPDEESERFENIPFNDEFTVYSPVDSLSQSHPKITLKTAPTSPPSAQEELRQENAIVRASSSRKSTASISSLVRSASALSLNASLSLPPKLLSYVAEDGSPVVQEYVPEDRTPGSSPRRRSSTPSIRDLPSPLKGISPLEITPTRPPKTKLKKPKLTPLPRR